MIIEIILAILVFVILYYAIILRRGNLGFWKKAQKHPDIVFEYLIKDDAWIIDDGKVKVDKDKFTGPFSLYVPSIGKTVKFYGKINEYEKSQQVIEEKLIE